MELIIDVDGSVGRPFCNVALWQPLLGMVACAGGIVYGRRCGCCVFIGRWVLMSPWIINGVRLTTRSGIVNPTREK